ncbi:hypothetical protein BH09SUM1_BH09SUM1_11750 [soil metagenome]
MLWLPPVCFAIVAIWLSGERSYHIDEQATISEGLKRVTDRYFQSQHSWFLDFYHWFWQWGTSPAIQRAPAALAGACGIAISAAVVRRIAGVRAAWIFCALCLCTPLLWQSSMEIRFYGFLFFFGALSFAGAWLTFGDHPDVGIFLVAMPAVAAYRFHPATLPYHGVLIVVCGIEVLRRVWLTRREVEADFRVWALRILGAVVAMNLVVAPYLLYDDIIRQAFGLNKRNANAAEELLPNGWSVSDMISHSLSWTGRTPIAAWNFAASACLAIFAIAGAWYLIRTGRRRTLLWTFVIALLMHYAAAYVIGWHARWAIKYLISSLPVLYLLSAAGIEALLSAPAVAASAQRQRAVLASVAILFLAPGAWETALLMKHDPSNALPIARAIRTEMKAGDPMPVLFAPAALITLEEWHATMGIGAVVRGYEREDYTADIEKSLVLRREPFFKAEIANYPMAEIGGLKTTEAFREVGNFTSSFHEHFSYRLWKRTAWPVVAPGASAELVNGMRVAFPEAGRWRVQCDGECVIGGRTYRSGDALEIAGSSALEWRGAGTTLVPDFSAGAVKRSAAFAEAGALSEYNRSSDEFAPNGYMLSNNTSVSYSLFAPDAPAQIIVDAIVDAPPGGGAIMTYGGHSVAAIPPKDAKAGDHFQYRLDVPQESRGKSGLLRIEFLGENSAHKPDAEDVSVLKLVSISIESPPSTAPESGNFLAGLSYPPLPAWAPGGVLKPSLDLFSVHGVTGDPKDPLIVTMEGGDVVMTLPRVMEGQGVTFPLMPVAPGQTIGFRLSASSQHVDNTTLAPLIYFFTAQTMLKVAEPSALPIGRRDLTPVNRVGLRVVPEKADGAMMVIYFNTPKDDVPPPGARFVLHSFQFLRGDEAGIGNGE